MTKKTSATLFDSAPTRKTAAPFEAKTFARVLAAWFEISQRDLPWRRLENARDAYRVLVSEVMLQQTTVAAVVPFYEKFLARFPNVETLAAASIEEVLPLWAGLGYYRRARMLHQCAREIVKNYGGVFPRDAARVLALPGIGRYTAGAVSSIAHEIAAPIVDANVARVFARIFLIEGELKSGGAQNQLWKRATQIVEAAHENAISPATINPALMELGALVCTPRAPRCEDCPVQSWCGAFATNRQNELPFVPPRRAAIELHDVCVFAQRAASTRRKNGAANFAENVESGANESEENARVLLRQRPHDADVWWRGMWELPRTTRRDGESEEAALVRLLQELGFDRSDFSIGAVLRRVKHGVTHHAISLDCYEVSIGEEAPLRSENAQWFAWREIEELALPSSMKTLVKWLRAPKPQARSATAQRALF